MDLQTWLSAISTVAIVIALVFGVVQIRQTNRTRMEQAAIAMLQSSQGDSWTRAIESIRLIPSGASAEELDAGGAEALRSIFDFGVRLETFAYMTFLHLVSLEVVDDLIGGIVLVFWSRSQAWVTRERARTANPKLFEWCEWLSERIQARRSAGAHEPAYSKHRNWR